jgi:Right handed beta helix region
MRRLRQVARPAVVGLVLALSVACGVEAEGDASGSASPGTPSQSTTPGSQGVSGESPSATPGSHGVSGESPSATPGSHGVSGQSAAPARVPGPHGPGGSVGVPPEVSLTAAKKLRITRPNTVIDARDIRGRVVVRAPGVVISRSRIRGSGTGSGVWVKSGDVTISDSEISDFENGIAGGSWRAFRLDLHGMTGDGVKLGSDVQLSDSWIHDLTPARGAHADGGQMETGVRNLLLTGNTIDVSASGRGNAALFLAPDLGPSTRGPVTIRNNYLDGGNFTVFCLDGNDGQYRVRNISITDNVFGDHHRYGRKRVNVPVVWTGNTSYQ